MICLTQKKIRFYEESTNKKGIVNKGKNKNIDQSELLFIDINNKIRFRITV